MLKVNLEDGSQTGEGGCMITGEKGAQLFAKWACSGYHLIGGKGEFTSDEGTGRFLGMIGGGPVVVRTTIRKIAVQANENPDVEAAFGIAFWKRLRYQLP